MNFYLYHCSYHYSGKIGELMLGPAPQYIVKCIDGLKEAWTEIFFSPVKFRTYNSCDPSLKVLFSQALWVGTE